MIKFHSLDQLAAFNMRSMGIPDEAAFEEPAARVECAVKQGSTPASYKNF